MAARTRPVDRGSDRARLALSTLGRELRAARTERGLSLAAVGAVVGISASQTSRIERGRAPNVSIWQMTRLMTTVGLDLAIKAFPGGQPVRDAAQVALLTRFRSRLHPTLRWATEVPLPVQGDQRAWDAVVPGAGWRFGIEAETAPTDVQALLRRIALKHRDSGLDGVILVLGSTRRTRALVTGARDLLASAFPVPGRRALELLAAGVALQGNALVVI
jgi:hypothetical protein